MMKVTLLGHTCLDYKLFFENGDVTKPNKLGEDIILGDYDATAGQVIALAAIRQCYSHKTALEVLETESEKYFGEDGKEGQRLFNHIVKSGHTSTLEHIHFTFAVEGVSRALLAQLTRHRQLSFSVQSQRYNRFNSDSRSCGFDYVVPEKVEETRNAEPYLERTALDVYLEAMDYIQGAYDALIKRGIPQEDARAVLPNAATCNLVTSGNLRAWLEFYRKRSDRTAQKEIRDFAELIKNAIIEVEPWVEEYFNIQN